MEDKKPHKERAEKYETKVAIKGKLEDMMAAALKPKKKATDESKKKVNTHIGII